MPYPSEHACSLQEGQGRCWSEPGEIAGKPVRNIICENGRASIRFPIEEWTEEAARRVCNERGGEFHPAAETSGGVRGMRPFGRILTFPSHLKAVQDSSGARRIEGYVSSDEVDLQGERVHQAALLRAYERSEGVPYLRDHDPRCCIGHVVEWRLREGKTFTAADILPEGKSALADDLWNLLELGVPVSQSIGFNPVDPKDWDKSGEYDSNGVWIWGGQDGTRDIELLETSAVMFGANRQADLHAAKAMGLDLTLPMRARGATQFADLPLAPEDHPWDADAALKRVRTWAGGDENIDWARYRRAFLWYDEDAPDQFGSYKLPFADVVNGGLRAVWRACAACMAVLSGARGGVDIPDEDRDAVLNHLRRYYEKFDKEWPLKQAEEERRFIDDLTAAKGRLEAARNITRHWCSEGRALSPEVLAAVASPMVMCAEIMRTGRVLSDRNREAVMAAIAALQEVLARDDESRARTQAAPPLAAILDRPYVSRRERPKNETSEVYDGRR